MQAADIPPPQSATLDCLVCTCNYTLLLISASVSEGHSLPDVLSTCTLLSVLFSVLYVDCK